MKAIPQNSPFFPNAEKSSQLHGLVETAHQGAPGRTVAHHGAPRTKNRETNPIPGVNIGCTLRYGDLKATAKQIACAGLALLIALVIVGSRPAHAAAPTTAATQNDRPVKYREEVRVNPLLHLHIATVDLTDPRVSLRVVRGGDDPDGDGPWQTKLDTVRNIATREKLDVAVNANFFSAKDAVNMFGRKNPYLIGNWAVVSGWAMSDGVLWANKLALAMLVVDDKGSVSIGPFAKIPNNARQVVSSGEMLVLHGRNVATSKDRAPRTSIGVDRDGKTLTILVVDGRRDYFSVGMNGAELADELIKLGCFDALILDGGGSATMVMRNPADQTVRVMNHPSDGHDLPIDLSIERPVANAFGVVVREGATTKP